MSRSFDEGDELRQWRELFECVVLGKLPLLPRPDWCQDVAFVAFTIDRLSEREP